MKTVVEPLEGNKVKLSVEVDELEFERALDATFRRIAREVRIPGFRPGKAPRRLLEARMGSEAARQEALRDALPDYYAKALKETDVDAIAPPEIDITGGQESGPVSFDAVVQIRPQLRLAGYAGLQVTVPSPEVIPAEIDAQIDRLRNNFGELRPVERAARDGDHLTVDIKGTRGGEAVAGMTTDDFLYELGSGTVLPELDEQLRGAKVGDILSFDAELPGGEGSVALRVLVKDVKEKILPEVTDEWASEASEFDTVDELRADLAKRIGLVKRVQSQLALRNATISALVQLVAEDAPEPLVDAEVERQVHDLHHRLEAQGATIPQYLQAIGQSEQTLLAEMRQGAEESVKAELALRAVAEAEDIEATDEEVEAEIARLAERMDQRPEQLRRQLERAEQMAAVRSDVRKSKALEWLVEQVVAVDDEGHPIDRSLLSPEPEGDAPDTSSGAESKESVSQP
jgi:trigger factor